MRYLIDTNIFIFLIEKAYNRLSSKQLKVIDNPDTILFLTEASLYEIAIKVRLGKPEFSHLNMKGIEKDRKLLGIKIIKTKILHYQNIPSVPQIFKKDGKTHADPFDLLIISTAEIEKLSILSSDEYFPDYPNIKTI